MIFRQLYDESSSTYTYLLACPDTRQAILIDPVLEMVDRDLSVLRELQLSLYATVETHIHADHITGAVKLKALSDCKIAGPALDNLSCRDIQIKEGEDFKFGHIALQPLYTPGHTDAHHAFLLDNNISQCVFTGDALLIDACGRTDFQSGDAETLYKSIHEKLFRLPEETLVYPGHDYEQRFISSIAQEKRRNPRLGNNRDKDSFIELMNALDLEPPKKMDYAVPANMQCGTCPDNMPEELKKFCETQG